MPSLKPIEVRKMIGIFLEKNPNLSTNEVFHYFRKMEIPKTTIYRNVKKFKSGLGYHRKPGSGQLRAINDKLKTKIKKYVINKVGKSNRSISREFGITHPSVAKILKELGIQRKKRIRCPKSDEKQVKKQKRCLEKLRRGLLKPSNGIDIIMDDESYLTADGSDTHFNDSYLTHPSVPVPQEVKFRPKAKYPLKVMVWVAMSPKGLSQAYVVKSGQAVNSDTYQ